MSNHTIENQLALIISLLETLPEKIVDASRAKHVEWVSKQLAERRDEENNWIRK